ncbi:uncharacterized protein L969DRAFT_69780 [Mixia osmundae IAM 14324]|uniref:JmjC domain-containing protein n=1 Tax=Mixia osmundae (strain CBS 9802 / IAM 14324 / JCM 22182 / KY 12970) TaxID=764103 RepID=G7DZD5_MIXOS|nr:uncharacterized protein L969DRAFT_69780 [Mixia osmundae IAM 14324]KEI42590.1 hypothetical protein L969DRAFT_69780 [Mixia osmundae IAM 14324]GAA95945.1 hypothetical protein E5Q_02603 [Mixia osmundae IAM 14324]
MQDEPPCFEQTLTSLKTGTAVRLAQCGPGVAWLFEQSLSKSDIPSARDLLTLAQQRLRIYHYDRVPACWRYLYTDATLLLACARCKTANRDESWHAETVRLLDMAIIVAGAEDREPLIFALMRFVQQSLVHDIHDTPAKRPGKRRKVDQPDLTRPIELLDRMPLFMPKQPRVVRNGCSDWPACIQWPDLSYLSRKAGPARVIPVEVGGSYTQDDWTQRIMPFDDFLCAIASEDVKADKLYLAQHDLFRQIPELRDDIIVPDVVFSAPQAPDHLPSYHPPMNELQYSLNAWFGPAGTLSPAHTDPYFNCYIQVAGRKQVWIAPPSLNSRDMHCFDSSVDVDEAGQTALMTNTSRVNVFDETSLPVGFDRARNLSQEAILNSGDVLLLPPGWWHAFRSLTTSHSVSIWF